MTPVLTITSSGLDCPEYGWKSCMPLPAPLRIDSVLRPDGVCLFLVPCEADYGISFSIFRIGAWSRYVLRTGRERLLKLCITVTANFRKFVRKARRAFGMVMPAARPAVRTRENCTVLRL